MFVCDFSSFYYCTAEICGGFNYTLELAKLTNLPLIPSDDDVETVRREHFDTNLNNLGNYW